MRRSKTGFALYEVLMGLAIFALGVLALGRAVQNCMNASTLNAEENRVREGRYHQSGNSLFRPDLGWLHLRQIETTRSNHSAEDRRFESS